MNKVFLLFAIVLLGGMVACQNDPTMDEEPTPNSPAPAPQPEEAPSFPGFDLELQAGDYWEFYWTKYTSSIQQGSGRESTVGGYFRLTLGDPVDIDGQEMFPLEVTGRNLEEYAGIRWQFLGLADHRLLGSVTGDSISVVFDAREGTWTGGGFFAHFDPESTIALSESTLENAFLNTSALSAGHAKGQTVCEIIAGERICAGESNYSITTREFYKPGIGPIGYYHYLSFSSGGVGSFVAQVTEINVGLVASSFQVAGFDPGIPWAFRADMPATVFRPLAAVWNDRIYLFGGSGDVAAGEPEHLQSLYIYDPRADSWDKGPDIPYPLSADRGQAHVVDDRVYFTQTVQGRMPVYDLTAQAWAPGPEVPADRLGSQHGSVRIGNDLIFFNGGDAHSGPFLRKTRIRVFRLDLETGFLSGDAHSDFGAHAYALYGAVGYGEVAYLWGDLIPQGGEYRSGMLRYDTGVPEGSNPWFQEVIEPANWSMQVVGDRLFRLEDESLRVMDLKLDRENPSSVDKWVRGFESILPKSGKTTAVWDGKIFVFGGFSSGTFSPTVEVYDPSQDWKLQ